MSDLNHPTSDLIYQLDDKPPFFQALLGAVTHLLALFVPMVMPALIVGKARIYPPIPQLIWFLWL